MSNPFYSPDEVSDDDFLRNSRRGIGSNGGGGGGLGSPNDDYERKRQLMMEKRREIEERTMDSSHRSLGLLYESEKVGLATAEELSRQKEQLKNTEHRLDDINATLKTSERHLQGVKSVFGGIMNYLTGRRAAPGTAGPATAGGPNSMPVHSSSMPPIHSSSESSIHDLKNQPQQHQNHPGLRVRGMGGGGAAPDFTSPSSSHVDEMLDRNLQDMSAGLSRLKGLAEGLNSELNEHNQIIDSIEDKVEQNKWRVDKQNKDMAKLLKK